MSASCGHDHDFDGASRDYRMRLIAVIVINAAMFAVEMLAGEQAGSQALKADALDFFADALTYGLSLAVIGASLRVRATAALVKGVSLLLMGLWVAGTTLSQFFGPGVPEAPVMGGAAVLALAANLASVLILMAYKDGDANVRSVWLCSRNDAIGNMAVMIASAAVWFTSSALPDLIVAAVMSGLFLSSASQILLRAYREWRVPGMVAPAAAGCCAHDHDHGHAHAHGPGHNHH
jgi:Co/Zn/Cd efflux system component